jgi:gliding motility-associated-like protein
VLIDNPTAAVISVSVPGLYTFVVERADNGCRDTVSVEVFDYVAGPQPEVIVEAPTCRGDRNGLIHVEADPAHAPYQFSLDGFSQGNDPDFTDLPGGTYVLEATDAQGCTWTTEVEMPDPAPLVVGLGADLHVEYGEVVVLQADVTVPPEALDAVLWTPDTLFHCLQSLCLEQTLVATAAATIEITVVDTNGCIATDRLDLAVRLDDHVYIPNVFSPNGDGENDAFTVFGNEEVQEIIELRIYDRWGEDLYHAKHFPPNDPQHGWEGVCAGQPLNPAVFVYWALVRFKDGSEQFYSGDVTLLR